jgi:multidrug efflux pump subunit AcrA (membrane-fusion protein)
MVLRAPYVRGTRSRGGPADFQLVLTELAEAGKKVKEGDVVAVFDAVNMRLRLDDEQADRVQLEGQLEKMKADQLAETTVHEQQVRVTLSNRDKARLDLRTVKVRSVIDAELFKLSLEEAEAAYKDQVRQIEYLKAKHAADRRSLELQLERAVVEEKRAQANLDRFTVRAPMDGLVVSQDIYRNGELAQIRNGDQLRSGQPYLRIVDLRSLIVRATVNQADVANLRLDSPARIHFDAYPGIELPGRVLSIGAIARSGGWRPSYVAETPLTIQIEGTDPKLIPSLSVSADIVVAKKQNAEILPREAVFREADGDSFVYVQGQSGWEKRELEIGLENHVAVAVESGVHQGERIAAEDPGEPAEGDADTEQE